MDEAGVGCEVEGGVKTTSLEWLKNVHDYLKKIPIKYWEREEAVKQEITIIESVLRGGLRTGVDLEKGQTPYISSGDQILIPKIFGNTWGFKNGVDRLSVLLYGNYFNSCIRVKMERGEASIDDGNGKLLPKAVKGATSNIMVVCNEPDVDNDGGGPRQVLPEKYVAVLVPEQIYRRLKKRRPEILDDPKIIPVGYRRIEFALNGEVGLPESVRLRVPDYRQAIMRLSGSDQNKQLWFSAVSTPLV